MAGLWQLPGGRQGRQATSREGAGSEIPRPGLGAPGWEGKQRQYTTSCPVRLSSLPLRCTIPHHKNGASSSARLHRDRQEYSYPTKCARPQRRQYSAPQEQAGLCSPGGSPLGGSALLLSTPGQPSPPRTVLHAEPATLRPRLVCLSAIRVLGLPGPVLGRLPFPTLTSTFPAQTCARQGRP